jgi:uncharacterized protein YcfJ
MKRSSILIAVVSGLALAGGATAQSYDYRYADRYDSYDRYDRYRDRYVDDRYVDDRYRTGGQRYEWADVIRVDPIIAAYQQPIRRSECWSQPVVYREPVRYRSGGDRTPAILGAIVGGAVGNQFGSGRGRDAATVAGAALGYSAVRDSQRYHGGYVSGGRSYQVYEQRCAPRTSYVRDERVSGYDVTYRYRGEVYRTTTDYHPGDRIQIRVDVQPVR